MENYTVVREQILNWAYLFHWAYARNFMRVMTEKERWVAMERNLPYLVRNKKLKTRQVGHALAYSLKGTRGISDHAIQHGLKCSEALGRFHRSKVGEYVSERYFRAAKYKPIPEFAVHYNGGDGVIFLFEYSTADNFRRIKLIEKKLQMYRENLDRFRKEWKAEPYVIVVIDGTEDAVDRLAGKYDYNNFYFTTERLFYSVQLGEQLSSAIYTWRGEKVCLTGKH
jgi:hypothetical protein